MKFPVVGLDHNLVFIFSKNKISKSLTPKKASLKQHFGRYKKSFSSKE